MQGCNPSDEQGISGENTTGLLAEGRVDDVQERPHIQRLDQVGVGRCRAQALLLVARGIRADHDHRDRARGGSVPQPPQHLVAAQIRQMHVQHDQMGMLPARQVHTQLPLRCRQHGDGRTLGKDGLHQRHVRAIVLDQQDGLLEIRAGTGLGFLTGLRSLAQEKGQLPRT